MTAKHTIARHAAPMFSVRTLEHSEQLSSPELPVEQARLAPWTPEQMAHYCTLHLGPDNALWPQIDAEAGLRELCALGEHDRRQLADNIWWREHLSALPEEGALVPGLARQAEAMHRSSQGTEVSLPRKDVATWFATPAERTAWLKAAEALNLAEVELGGRFRFTHQLWQEYFAARHLRDLPAASGALASAALPDLGAPPPEPLDRLLGRLAAKSPLPGPGVCGWEEAVKLAVQLSTTPERWIAALQPVNLPLAGGAARLCLARLQAAPGGPTLLHALRQALLRRSRDAAVDLRQRIEAAEALGWIGDPRHNEGRGPGPQQHRFLMPKPAHWVPVPGRSFRIGGEGGHDNELPVTEVRLHPFRIAFAPVTRNTSASSTLAAMRWMTGGKARRRGSGAARGCATRSESTTGRPGSRRCAKTSTRRQGPTLPDIPSPTSRASCANTPHGPKPRP